MKKISKKPQPSTVTDNQVQRVVGLDLGDRYSYYSVLSSNGELMEQGRIQTTTAALEKHFGAEPRMRIALECELALPVG